MATFKIYNSSFGITYNGQNYEFLHVDGLTIENNERKMLVRGANASDKEGIIFTEGMKDAKTWTLTVLGMEKAMFDLLVGIYNRGERIDCWCVDNTDGSNKTAKNAILSQEPMQLLVDESAESMNVDLMIMSYDVTEVHKS